MDFLSLMDLPHQSHQYRINQNGNKLFDIMNKTKRIFKYNASLISILNLIITKIMWR